MRTARKWCSAKCYIRRLRDAPALLAQPAHPIAPLFMALPPAAPDRQLKHRRQIDVQVFARGDGLWEVDTHLTDVKTRDATLGGQIRPAGEPIHDLLLRLVVNDQLDIVEAGSHSERTPHPGHCDDLGDTYAQLVGLNLLKGFRWAAMERLGGPRGCTHLTELTQLLPTAVMQGLAGEGPSVFRRDGDKPPYQLNRCHALRTDGEVVRQHYPRWYQPLGSTATNPSATAPPSPLSGT